MSLFLCYHPWPGGSMAAEQMLHLVSDAYPHWMDRGVRWIGYMGTPTNGEGWCLFEALDQRTLIELFRDEHIPYIAVTPVWRLAEEDLSLTRELGAA